MPSKHFCYWSKFRSFRVKRPHVSKSSLGFQSTFALVTIWASEQPCTSEGQETLSTFERWGAHPQGRAARPRSHGEKVLEWGRAPRILSILILTFKWMKTLSTLGCELDSGFHIWSTVMPGIFKKACYLKWPQTAKSEGKQSIKKLLKKWAQFFYMKMKSSAVSAIQPTPFHLQYPPTWAINNQPTQSQLSGMINITINSF